MTERQYYTFLLGYNNRKLNEARLERRRLWTMICGYADPKKLPSSEISWMPLKGDPIANNKMTTEQMLTAFDKFKNLKKSK